MNIIIKLINNYLKRCFRGQIPRPNAKTLHIIMISLISFYTLTIPSVSLSLTAHPKYNLNLNLRFFYT